MKFVKGIGWLIEFCCIFRCHLAAVSQIVFIENFSKLGGQGITFENHGRFTVELLASRIQVVGSNQGIAPVDDGVFGVDGALGLPVPIVAPTVPFPYLDAAAVFPRPRSGNRTKSFI